LKKLLLVVSDLHVGSTAGLCPRGGLQCDDGVIVPPSDNQLELIKAFDDMVSFALSIKRVKHRALICNGDLIDGFHHGTVAITTNNIDRQEAGAVEILQEVAGKFDKVYINRGTEVHVGQSGQSEERIARIIGAVQNEQGNYSSYQTWLDVDGLIFNIAHHIQTTSSAAYESSAPMRELVAAMVEAGQWGQPMPDVLIRSHRHRYSQVIIPSRKGEIRVAVTPGFQLRTPFVERIDRMKLPNIGGLIIIVEDGQCQIIPRVYQFATTPIHSF
jgi:hypothetical protein